uniref:Tektin n=1 Tax=Gouania willdenowi TaxID=441366 RepID=A0A8C5HBG6_GOUWI
MKSSSFSKPGLCHNVPEWNRNNQQLSTTAQHEQQVSTTVRQEGKCQRNKIECQTTFDESCTSGRLRERVWDLARWKEVLESCAQKVDEEMQALTLSKEQSEHALAATVTPLEVSTECLTLRDGRRGMERVVDPVDEELRKEVVLIERVQGVLQQHIDKALEQLGVLQEIRHQLTSDLQNKMEALDIDMTCLSLTTLSPTISLKPNPTRIPSGSSTPQEWLEFSHSNVSCAHNAMQKSQQLREETSLSRAQLQNEMEAQCRATEFTLRKRNHDEKQARDELQWQIKTTEDEMSEMEAHILGLEADLQAKTFPLMLAHTRLEKRTARPGMDLCRDEVQRGLVDEVQQLEASILVLKKKLSEWQVRRKQGLSYSSKCQYTHRLLLTCHYGEN